MDKIRYQDIENSKKMNMKIRLNSSLEYLEKKKRKLKMYSTAIKRYKNN